MQGRYSMRHAVWKIVRATLWLGVCNLLAAALAAQCSDAPLNIPPAAYVSGDHSYSGFPSATNSTNTAPTTSTASPGFQLSAAATATFSAPNCIHLAQGFSAQAGSATNMFTAWVNVGPEVISLSPSNSSGYNQVFTWTVSSPSWPRAIVMTA